MIIRMIKQRRRQPQQPVTLWTNRLLPMTRESCKCSKKSVNRHRPRMRMSRRTRLTDFLDPNAVRVVPCCERTFQCVIFNRLSLPQTHTTPLPMEVGEEDDAMSTSNMYPNSTSGRESQASESGRIMLAIGISMVIISILFVITVLACLLVQWRRSQRNSDNNRVKPINPVTGEERSAWPDSSFLPSTTQQAAAAAAAAATATVPDQVPGDMALMPIQVDSKATGQTVVRSRTPQPEDILMPPPPPPTPPPLLLLPPQRRAASVNENAAGKRSPVAGKKKKKKNKKNPGSKGKQGPKWRASV